MRYRLKNHITVLKEEEELQEGEFLIQIISTAQAKDKFEKVRTMPIRYLMSSLENPEYCKADLFHNCIVGTFVIPDKEDLINKENSFGFYMDRENLIFIDDGKISREILDNIEKNQLLDKEHIPHFLFEFMTYLISDEVAFLQQFEEGMSKMEEQVLRNQFCEIQESMLRNRKKLRRLNSYYNQLIDMSQTMTENYNHLLDEEECQLFHMYADRVDRLAEHAKNLKEYALQIHEMYQTQNQVRQNRIMQFLTVVTTVFMPLTLLTGWYGMNFAVMPELQWKYGYGAMCIVSLILILMEMIYFKKKKWW